MANIWDYLARRGNTGWEALAFNEVDNLILSELVYVDFADIVPADGGIALCDASEIFFARHTEEEINARVSSTKTAAFLMRDMAQTKRFGNIRICNYINDVSVDEQSQFCAMTVVLGDGRINVVFSGTDSTIVGWKENFNMSFLSETPGQLKAAEYLERAAAEGCPLRVMGHSKGGNLSVYAAAHAAPAVMDHIEAVYSNDGPGLLEEMTKEAGYQRILPKIRSIVPEYSIVGMFFTHEEAHEVVKSSSRGAGQHDVMSWEVEGDSLVHLSSVDERSILLDKTLKAWVFQMDTAQREEFVDTLFAVLDAADIRTLDDFAAISPAKAIELMKSVSVIDRENQEIVKKTLRRLFEEGEKTIRSALRERWESDGN